MSSSIQAWLAEGKLDRLSILHRLTPTDYLPIIETRMLDLTSNNMNRLTEAAFIIRLRCTSRVFCSSGGVEAGQIIFDALRYLASYPFPSPSNADGYLSSLQLARALAWLFPSRYGGYMFNPSSSARPRSKADHTRIVFQSLAVRRPENDLDADLWDQEARDSASDGVDAAWLECTSCNRDGDGDQLYHDLLDVIHISQPLRDPVHGDVHRDEFREVAKELHGTDLRLHELAVTRDRLTTLFKMLLVAQWGESQGYCHLEEEHSAAAERIASSYVPEGSSGANWLTFNHVFKNSTPHIFDPLYRILAQVLLGKIPNELSGEVEAYPLPSVSELGSASVLAQLGAVLSTRVVSSLSRSMDWVAGATGMISPSDRPALSRTTEDQLYLISCTAETGSEHLIGVFFPSGYDENSTKAGLIHLIPKHYNQKVRGIGTADEPLEPCSFDFSGGFCSGSASIIEEIDVRGTVLSEPRRVTLNLQQVELWRKRPAMIFLVRGGR